MKDNYRHVSLTRLCRLLGITRQSWYQYFWRIETLHIEQQVLLQQVRHIRKTHRRMGTRKLYELLAPFMLDNQIKMGRDALFDLLATNELLVRKKRRRVYTTNSHHWFRKYPNLIRELTPTAPNQLWVSDITYWKIQTGYVYISFITDAYSRKIVGYQVAKTLETVETIKALKMAILGLTVEPDSHFQLIHHSDRGLQYCSRPYVKLLQDNDIQISMTESGDPLENAIAERVNGIIKQEYLAENQVKTINEAKKLLSYVVNLYNQERPHLSISNLTPNNVHENKLKTEKLWKNYYKKKEHCKPISGL